MKQSYRPSTPNYPDISISLIGVVVGILVGVYIANLPLGIIFTAVCVSLVLLLFRNFDISNQPSIAIVIAFLVLPILTLIDPDLVIPLSDLIIIIIGIAIGLIIVLGHLGASFDESTFILAALFILLNYISYEIDNSGRLNLLIIWVFFAFIALLIYYLMKTIPEKLLSGSYVGREGIVVTSMFPEGKIQIDDEIWKAQAQGDPIVKGTKVRVVDQDEGLKLIVIPVE
ncbi:MAG: NfeD family protein [Candidatus Hodarchaeales archaeon]|jgi:membrane-bound ClpP family serine protease